MKINDLDSWAQSHFDYFLDGVRIYLGVGLLFKGVSFLTHGELLSSLNGTALAGLAPIVPYIHIVCGALLAIGLFPRIAAIVNIPILLAAVFMVHTPELHTLRGREGFEFSALVLFLLCLIAVRGAGPLSVMRMWRRAPAERPANSFQLWVDQHPDVFVDLIRIYLGIGLFVKGMYIMDHRDEILTMVGGQNFSLTMVAAAHYVIPAHLVGGVLLAFGILTRWAAAAQIPPLLGALFYAFLPRFTALEMRQSVEFTTLVLFLLALITLFGEGRIALEHHRRPVGYTPNLQPVH
jgi:putative oxidoreductase